MSRELKPGDRVRVTAANRVPGYRAGNRGTVLRAVAGEPGDARSYLVAVDTDASARTGTLFAEDEIELDM